MIYEDLKDKRVLVTGSSSGIGAAAAEMFSNQGSFVGVHYFRTKDGAEKTLAKVKESYFTVKNFKNMQSLAENRH